MASWRLGGLLGFLMATLLGGSAGAAGLGVGVYAPDVRLTPFQSFALAQSLAQHLSAALGVKVQGIAYKNYGDLGRDLKNKKVHFAVLGAFHATAGAGRVIIASAQLAGQRDLRWSLMSKTKASLAALKGQVLQLPSVGGLVHGLVENGLLGDNLAIARHFKIVYSPSLASSMEAVRLGQAQVVFAPVGSAGLVPIMERTLTVPPPAFVQLDRGLPAEQSKKAAQAILSYKGTKVLTGWEAASAAEYTHLAALARKQPLRMVMAATAVSQLRHGDLIDVRPLSFEFPELDNKLFTLP